MAILLTYLGTSMCKYSDLTDSSHILQYNLVELQIPLSRRLYEFIYGSFNL
jgi:hypothetical protein